MRIYLVGGAVRDELLGRTPLDRDYVVLGATEREFAARFPDAKKIEGKEPLFIHRGSQYTLSPCRDIESDLARRDLTINAFAKDGAGEIRGLDPSWSDLEQRVLRPVAEENFLQDPARVYRAARFAACLPDFKVAPGLLAAMTKTASTGRLVDVAAERVGQEAMKAFSCAKPGRFIELLLQTRIHLPWFCELETAAAEPETGTDISGPSITSIVDSMDAMAGSTMRVWLVLSLALGLAGRGAHNGTDRCGRIRFERHNPAQRLASRLRLANRFVLAGKTAAAWSVAVSRYDALPCSCKVDLLLALEKVNSFGAVFDGIEVLTGNSFIDEAIMHRDTIRTVRLPEEMRNKGKDSGDYLKKLRCAALSKNAM